MQKLVYHRNQQKQTNTKCSFTKIVQSSKVQSWLVKLQWERLCTSVRKYQMMIINHIFIISHHTTNFIKIRSHDSFMFHICSITWESQIRPQPRSQVAPMFLQFSPLYLNLLLSLSCLLPSHVQVHPYWATEMLKLLIYLIVLEMKMITVCKILVLCTWQGSESNLSPPLCILTISSG